MTRVEQIQTSLITAVLLTSGAGTIGFYSGLATRDALANETEARVEKDEKLEEAQTELAKAVTEHIRKADAQQARVDVLLEKLDEYIKKNGG